jgi:hypothetical protein
MPEEKDFSHGVDGLVNVTGCILFVFRVRTHSKKNMKMTHIADGVRTLPINFLKLDLFDWRLRTNIKQMKVAESTRNNQNIIRTVIVA